MKQNLFEKIKKVHFIGIGGSGVSSLARMMLLLDKKVSGTETALVGCESRSELIKQGAKVFAEYKRDNISKNIDMIIYSPAYNPDDNVELIQAKKLGISIYSYPEALGLISKEKYTIAISGTHGKTTTTSMVADILIAAKKDPMVVVGTQNNNFIMGKSKFFIVEACEYKESFLNLFPDILIITNIDNDHLDYYKNIKNIQKAFAKLINKVPKNGFIICNPEDKNTKQALRISKIKAKIIDYTKEKELKLKVPGSHNLQNAKAALVVAKAINIKEQKAQELLKKYAGTWRRFEHKGAWRGALIYDDYAHHPTEVKAILKAICEKFPNKKIIAVFQPHLYSRTKLLLNDFAKSFNCVDDIIITDIYAAREKDDKSIHAKDLVRAIKKENNFVQYMSDFKDIVKYLKKNANKDNIIITIGAGDVYKIGEKLIIE